VTPIPNPNKMKIYFLSVSIIQHFPKNKQGAENVLLPSTTSEKKAAPAIFFSECSAGRKNKKV
jgi:hypothetical protein